MGHSLVVRTYAAPELWQLLGRLGIPQRNGRRSKQSFRGRSERNDGVDGNTKCSLDAVYSTRGAAGGTAGLPELGAAL